MKILNWSHTDWLAKKFIFTLEEQTVGKLKFDSSWHVNALYTDKKTNLKFAQQTFLNRDVSITKDGKKIGEIHLGLFGEQILKIVTGEKFFLSTSLWEQEAYWKNEKGETVIKYHQELMSSMGKGSIISQDLMTTEMEKLLISSGVFVRQLIRKRRASIIVVMIALISAASSY